MVRINILYQSLPQVTGEWHAGHFQWTYTWQYLKFFEDGSLIYASIDGDNIEEINSWFNQNAQNVTSGKYRTVGSEIELALHSLTVQMSVYKDGKIVIHWLSGPRLYSPMEMV
jgi:hypothetical protein